MGLKNLVYTKPAKKDIHNFRKVLTDYNYIIGSGATPAIMQSMNLRLNLFLHTQLGLNMLMKNTFLSTKKLEKTLLQVTSQKK